MTKIIIKGSGELRKTTGWIKGAGRTLEKIATRIRPDIVDEHYFSGEEVCEKLHTSRRTLQTLRDEGATPYTSVTAAGGKLLYPESGLCEVLGRNYKDSRKYIRQMTYTLHERIPSVQSR